MNSVTTVTAFSRNRSITENAPQNRPYRLPEERGKPLPRPGWLPAVVVPMIWAALVWRLDGQHTAAVLPPFLLLGLLAVVLSWTDLDVHRLPEQITCRRCPR